MMRKILIGFAVFIAALFILEQIQQFWSSTIGRPKDVDPTVKETLIAPFANIDQEKQSPTAQERARLPENHIAMDQPHRAPFQIQEWTITAVSEAMSFDETVSYDQAIERGKGHFSPTGWEQYLQFLVDSDLARTLKSQNKVVRTVVQEDPFLLNDGAVDGRFRWLYEVPVMVTYLDRENLDYEEAQPRNVKMLIKVQVGRSQTTSDPAGLRVERWSGEIKR